MLLDLALGPAGYVQYVQKNSLGDYFIYAIHLIAAFALPSSVFFWLSLALTIFMLGLMERSTFFSI